MNCLEVKERFYHLTNVVVFDEERLEIAEHLKGCGSCRAFFVKELEWEKKLREKLQKVDPSPDETLQSEKRDGGNVLPVEEEQLLTRFLPPELTAKTSSKEMQTSGIIVCPQCQFQWNSIEAFQKDETVVLVEFHSSVLSPERSKLVFHHQEGCEISLFSKQLASLKEMDSQGKTKKELLMLKKNCPNFCLFPDNTEVCNTGCQIAEERGITLHFKKKKFN